MPDDQTSARGTLDWKLVTEAPELLLDSLRAAALAVPGLEAASIDPDLADTAAFCERYGVAAENSANCVIVTGKREGVVRRAAVMILATDRADVNGAVRREIDVRKATFAPLESAQELTGMQYGGITPVGLPEDWTILIDRNVLTVDEVVIGGGSRDVKFLIPTRSLAALPGARVTDLAMS